MIQMEPKIKYAILGLMLVIQASCSSVDKGAGKCDNYRPWMCYQGELKCETNAQGCQSCGCEQKVPSWQ